MDLHIDCLHFVDYVQCFVFCGTLHSIDEHQWSIEGNLNASRYHPTDTSIPGSIVIQEDEISKLKRVIIERSPPPVAYASAQLYQHSGTRTSKKLSRPACSKLRTTCWTRWLVGPKGLEIFMLRRGRESHQDPIMRRETRNIPRSKSLKIPDRLSSQTATRRTSTPRHWPPSIDRMDRLCVLSLNAFLGRSKVHPCWPSSATTAQLPKDVTFPSPRRHVLCWIHTKIEFRACKTKGHIRAFQIYHDSLSQWVFQPEMLFISSNYNIITANSWLLCGAWWASMNHWSYISADANLWKLSSVIFLVTDVTRNYTALVWHKELQSMIEYTTLQKSKDNVGLRFFFSLGKQAAKKFASTKQI